MTFERLKEDNDFEAPCDGFKCSSGPCIELGQVCNGLSDCPDGGDELNCEGELFKEAVEQLKRNKCLETRPSAAWNEKRPCCQCGPFESKSRINKGKQDKQPVERLGKRLVERNGSAFPGVERES